MRCGVVLNGPPLDYKGHAICPFSLEWAVEAVPASAGATGASADGQLSAIGYQLSVISYQLSVVSCQQ
jgi:hypothetical protein